MKNLLFALNLLSVLAFGQTNVEKLPSFYDITDGNKVISVDMLSNSVEPIVLYSTYNYKEVKCKLWDGQEWVDFGTFPAIKNRGQVNLELYNNNAYALVQGGEGWTLYEKLKDEDSWKIYGNPNFAAASELAEPALTFIEGNPVVYEQDLKNDKVIMFKYQNGEFLSLEGINLLTDISQDFRMVSNREDQMLMAWTSTGKKALHLYELNKNGDETAEKSITKGLKVKEVNEIIDLFYQKNKLYLFYFNNSWNFQAAKYNHELSKWESIDLAEEMGGLGCYISNDLSLVSKSRENDLPLFYKFNGKNWDNAVEVGASEISHGHPVKLVEALDDYFLLHHNDKGEVLIQKFTMD